MCEARWLGFLLQFLFHPQAVLDVTVGAPGESPKATDILCGTLHFPACPRLSYLFRLPSLLWFAFPKAEEQMFAWSQETV